MKAYRSLKKRQPSTWHMFHRLRLSFEKYEDEMDPVFEGPVEVDEVYPDGLVKNYSNAKRAEYRRKTEGKSGGTGDESIVIGMFDRDTGRVIAKVLDDGKGETLREWVLKHTVDNCIVITDGDTRYKPLANMNRRHFHVVHKKSEYVKQQLYVEGDLLDELEVTTNRIENFWGFVKSSIRGTFHKWSKKHMQRYFDHICGIRNIRDMDTWAQMCYVAERLIGRRLTYEELIEDNGRESGANDGETMRRRWKMIREDDEYDEGYENLVDSRFHADEFEQNEHEELTLFDVFNE